MYAYIAVAVALFLITRHILKNASKKRIEDFPRKFPDDRNKDRPSDFYDVAIVGAGPGGATCGYYLGKAGRKVLLLEKKQFPRDKHCGDAVVKTAIEILHEMGLYETLIATDKAKVSDSGGLVSPSGLSFIGRSKEKLGHIPAAIACKRIHLDNAIAMAAKQSGADLQENCSMSEVTFDDTEGLWTLTLDNSDKVFKARVLVCANGAPLEAGNKTRDYNRSPLGVCSRAYVEGGTHRCKADGGVFYPSGLLPGYAAVFKHPNDELNYCIYIIPGNPKVGMNDLAYWHEKLMKDDPYISQALGPDIKIERIKAGSLRLGGVPVSYGHHLLLVGDAAGMIDPMTGEGIHHATDGGKIAGEFLQEALAQGNYDSQVMRIYHDRWMDRFGFDFRWSMMICQLLYRFPILLDAATAAVARKGNDFLARWADIMTGRVPKIHLLRPDFVIVITFELLLLLAKRLFGFGPKKTTRSVDDTD